MDDQVHEDLTGSPSSSQRWRPSWTSLIVGAVIGLAFGFLFFGTGAESSTSTTTPVSTTDALLPTGELRPGFDQGLSAIVEAGVQGLNLVDWPPAELASTLSVTPLPFGDLGVTVLPSFDHLGRFIAVEVPMRDRPGRVLYAGHAGDLGTVATDVTGHAWHDSEPGVLAFTTERDGEIGLWVMTQKRDTVQNVTSAIGFDGARVVGFGDWGWALQDAEGDTTLLFNEFGEHTRSEPGAFLDSTSEGWLLVMDRGSLVMVDPDGTRETVGQGVDGVNLLEVIDAVGDFWAAVFAPDARRIAILGTRGMALVSGNAVVPYGASPQRPHIVANDDYVMYPRQAGGVAVVDLVTGEDFEILQDLHVRTVGFQPG